MLKIALVAIPQPLGNSLGQRILVLGSGLVECALTEVGQAPGWCSEETCDTRPRPYCGRHNHLEAAGAGEYLWRPRTQSIDAPRRRLQALIERAV